MGVWYKEPPSKDLNMLTQKRKDKKTLHIQCQKKMKFFSNFQNEKNYFQRNVTKENKAGCVASTRQFDILHQYSIWEIFLQVDYNVCISI